MLCRLTDAAAEYFEEKFKAEVDNFPIEHIIDRGV